MLKPAFQAACRAAVEALARETADGGPAVLIGTPWVEDGKLYNAYALLAGGRIEAIRFKVNLPNYGVFDEKRVFAAGPVPGPVNFRGVRLGLPVCEDTWTDWGDYENVVECLAETGAEIAGRAERLAVLARTRATCASTSRSRASPRPACRCSMSIRSAARMNWCSTALRSRLNADRSLAFQLPAFTETVVTTHWSRAAATLALRARPDRAGWRRRTKPTMPPACWACATMSTRTGSRGRARAVGRHRFGAVRGHGGRCAGRRARALRDAAVSLHVAGIAGPTPPRIARALGVRYDIVPIESAVRGLEAALAGLFAGTPRDVTEENLQARARGTILMAISNKFGVMVVTTGNKSEMSVGYATLYGDMNGGFNPIKDLYKTEVYRLARLRNGWKPAGALGPDGAVIPENVLTRAPSAELRENQTDQDTLPPYDVLDQILRTAGRARGADRGQSSPPVSIATP